MEITNKISIQYVQFIGCINRIASLYSSKKALKMILIAFMVIYCITESNCSTCPSSSSNSNAITSEQCSFTGYTITYAYSVASGQVTNSLYYLYSIYLSPSTHCAIRKVNQDESLAWMAAISLNPIEKSLTVDILEQYVYVASYTSQLDVVRLLSTTGAIIDAQHYSFLNGLSIDIKIHSISDSSGYYITGRDSSQIPNICKYLFSSPTSCQCQQIANFFQNAYGQLKLSDTTFFMLGVHPFPTYQLHLYKLSFGNSSLDWALKQACPSTCTAYHSESLIVSPSIYTFFVYGANKYLYMAVINATNGSVGSRYKSSLLCINYTVYGSAASGDYVVAFVNCSPYYLLIFNRETSVFSFKTFLTYLCGICLEASTERLVIAARKGNSGYITKFMIQSLSAHSDFQTAVPWTMIALSTGTEEITLDSVQVIGSITPQIVSASTYTNITVSYTLDSSYTSDVNYQTDDLSCSVLEGIISQYSPYLPCSISGSTSISFSISSYGTSNAPTWVSINSLTGTLSITAPEVNSDTEYYFYISSDVSGVSTPVQKLIKLTILNCALSNCQKCISTK